MGVSATRKYDAVFFDLYGTLVIDEQMPRANRQWTRRLGEYLASRGADARDDQSIFRAFWSKEMPLKHNSHTPFMKRLIDFTVESGGSPVDNEIATLADELCTLWQTQLPLADDVITIIEKLKKQYRVAVVSNFGHPPHVVRYLHSVGVTERIDGVFVSGDYPFEKPDPRLLLEACSDVGVEPAKTIYVGNSIVDYRASIGAGITPILIRRNHKYERWPDDGTPSRFKETDRELDEKIAKGELMCIETLSEIEEMIAV